jgi:hypothetical protein
VPEKQLYCSQIPRFLIYLCRLRPSQSNACHRPSYRAQR